MFLVTAHSLIFTLCKISYCWTGARVTIQNVDEESHPFASILHVLPVKIPDPSSSRGNPAQES
jgi:hypothetical protein